MKRDQGIHQHIAELGTDIVAPVEKIRPGAADREAGAIFHDEEMIAKNFLIRRIMHAVGRQRKGAPKTA